MQPVIKICVTGSNGKTTVTNLIYHMLKKAGKNAAMTGNVGNSFAMAVAKAHMIIMLLSSAASSSTACTHLRLILLF